MTRRLLWLAALLVLSAAPAQALLKFGVHAGLDLNARDETLLEPFQGPDLSGTETVTLRSGGISDPLLLGAHLHFGALPFIDLEAGLEGSFASYKYGYRYGDLAELEEEILFGRLSAYGSLHFSMIALPMFKAYVGGGLGYHLVTPLMSRDLAVKRLEDAGHYDLDLRSLLDREGVAGFHALGGLRFTPAFTPLALKLEARYHMLEQNAYGDDCHRFLTVVLGVDLGG